MKYLALLCNLHAEGPATLALLRRDGCEGLAALLEYEARDLARLLEWDETRAERFLREGGELSERMSEDILEPEAAGPSDEPEADDEEESEEEEHELDSAPMREVLIAWRGLDEREPPQPPAEFVLPRPAETRAPGTVLRALALEGLEVDLLRRLGELGVKTAEDLAERSPLELSRALGIGLTRVLHLCFLVRRATHAAARTS